MRTILVGKIRDVPDAGALDFMARCAVELQRPGVFVLQYRHEDGYPGNAGDLDACTCDPLDVALLRP